VEYTDTLREIQERDRRDASRDTAPMVAAPDAVLVDSSAQTIEDIVDFMARRVETVSRAAAP
jgi:cytidylate kinase